MQQREKIIRLWFDMWLQKSDEGILKIFSDDAIYIESWGPKYKGAFRIKQWFEEWNRRGTVLVWDIKQYFHSENQTVAEWYFKNRMNDGRTEEFDGVSLIGWTRDHKIEFLKEFGCNIHCYDPYENGPVPKFRDETSKWF
ncbi:MAG: nuclear transport factor 2 family protein [Clostridiales bacterium]|nr:nuclear transport factor 2 family protein [Clostridiales bacterium]